jgi:NTP pyrophosphatase (non-canonical NTP hydrolase)
MTAQEQAIQDVLEERRRQDGKWGEQNHDPFTYLTILMEEVGEAAQAALEARYGADDASRLAQFRKETVQVAAVAVAILECLYRDTWDWGNHYMIRSKLTPPANTNRMPR